MSFESALPVRLAGMEAALVIAHPGHELRLHGWLEAARPMVLVLTDGAGRSGRSRLPSTARVLEQTGASRGEIFGRFEDTALYAELLAGRTATFLALARELAALLAGVDYVVADAAEGYNPAHDLCRLLVDAALAGRRASNYDFPLIGPPERRLAHISGRVRVHLDEAAFTRKLAAAEAYRELGGEVALAMSDNGPDAFRVEVLDPAPSPALFTEPPYYERYGEQQVARGFYTQVLRYREHILPIAVALRALGPP